MAEYVLLALGQGISAVLSVNSSSSSAKTPSLPMSFLGIFIGTAIGIVILNVLYKSNGGSQGQHFLNRLLALSWVIGLRILIVVLPVSLIAALAAEAFPIAVLALVIFGGIGILIYSLYAMIKALETVSGRSLIVKLPSEV